MPEHAPSRPEPDLPSSMLRPAIVQSLAIAVQDAAAYLRSMQTLSVAATSLALRLTAEGDGEAAAKLTHEATAAVERARAHFEAVLQLAESGDADPR